ncbi:hypothetical protein BX265_6187 [Streptomyces sp. TLI_235]|nr:hypothetical protein [Streptomyces sp. TLI_235]PBC71577.1 hypothetical protein BX265_6187 [Streptomyces sp. TLI_235]
MVQPWYATREAVKDALDIKLTARSNSKVDSKIEAASRDVEGLCHRDFAPVFGTRYFDWPNGQYAAPWRLWLDRNELISLTTVTSGGVTIPLANINLEPNQSGPPYSYLELNISTSAVFGGGSTPQRSIAVTGLWGFRNDESPAGTGTATVSSSATSLLVSDSAAVGVGHILRCGTERLIVTEKLMSTTGQTLQSALTERKNDQLLQAVDGTAFTPGEVLLVGAERMRVDDIAGNALVVERAYDGTTLAAHASGTIYAPRSLRVSRGALGTTAAGITSGDALYRWEPPGPVRDLTIAEAIVALLQESSGYARVTGVGSQARQVGGGTTTKTSYGVGLEALREQVYTSHGRKARTRAV